MRIGKNTACRRRFARIKKQCPPRADGCEETILAMLDVAAIRKILPHRYPFLLVDRILEVEPGVRAVGLKNVTANEEFFQGHFPQKPIMPGVLVIESMAQVGGIMLLSHEDHQGKNAYLATVESCKFRRPIEPGDTLIHEVTMLRQRGNMGKVHCIARVDKQVAAEATLMFALVDPF